MNRTHLLLFCACLLLVAFSGGGSAVAQNTPAHRAALLVRYGDGRIETHCVRFAEDAITGEQLLRRTGMATRMEYGSIGIAVCMIGDQGCRYPAEACFCKCQGLGDDCVFWNYLRQTPDGWRAMPSGAGTPAVVDGSAFAWSWNAGDGERISVALPGVDVDAVCGKQTIAEIQPTRSAATEPKTVATADTRPAPSATIMPTVALAAATDTRPAPSATIMPTVALTAAAAPSERSAGETGGLADMLAFAGIAAVLVGLLFWLRRTRSAT
jgi:hypothetical protein